MLAVSSSSSYLPTGFLKRCPVIALSYHLHRDEGVPWLLKNFWVHLQNPSDS